MRRIERGAMLATLLTSVSLVGHSHDPRPYDWKAEKAYCAAVFDNSDGVARRNLIERCVNALKQFPRIATRYGENRKSLPLYATHLRARLWIKTVKTA